jgi:hypothetical protein
MSGSSLIDGLSQLRNAAEHLQQAWLNSEDGWNDVVRARIAEEQMEPLRKQLDQTFVALQQLTDVLNAAKRHCRDADREA